MSEVVVLGSHGLLVEAIRADLNGPPDLSAPIDLTDGAAPATAAVVLVDPDDDAWTEAATYAAPIVVVTHGKADAQWTTTAVLRGADGVIDAGRDDMERLRAAIATVVDGACHLDPEQVKAIVVAARGMTRPAPIRLTRREQDILELITKGCSVKQTAAQLRISPRTVENLQAKMFHKLEARNRAQAVHRALELGLIADRPVPEPAP